MLVISYIPALNCGNTLCFCSNFISLLILYTVLNTIQQFSVCAVSAPAG